MQNPLFVFYFEVFIFLNLRSIILLSAVAPPRHYRKLRQHDTNNGGLQTLRPQYHRWGEVGYIRKATSGNALQDVEPQRRLWVQMWQPAELPA